MAKLIYGVGINDSAEVLSPSIGGVQTKCKIYVTWYDMLRRCYSNSYQEKYPKYRGCTVDPSWFKFSAFKKWAIETRKADNLQLDKDLLVTGNKIYSPNTCCWISQELNKFLTFNQSGKSNNLPAGVTYKGNKLQATCNNPFTKKLEHLGYYTSVKEAHLAWLSRKSEIAKLYAEKELDARVKAALLIKFKNADLTHMDE